MARAGSSHYPEKQVTYLSATQISHPLNVKYPFGCSIAFPASHVGHSIHYSFVLAARMDLKFKSDNLGCGLHCFKWNKKMHFGTKR